MSDETKKGFGRPSALEAVRALQGVLKLSLYELDNDEDLTPSGEIDGADKKRHCSLWAFPANSSISCAPTAWKLTTPSSQLDQAVACSVGGCSAPYDTLDLSQVLPNGIFSQYRRRADMAGSYLRSMQPCFTPELFEKIEQLCHT